MKESVNTEIELTAPLMGKRFKTVKDMAKAIRMEEKAFTVSLNTLLNNGAIQMIHFNDQGWEIFFDGQGPWMTTDELMAATLVASLERMAENPRIKELLPPDTETKIAHLRSIGRPLRIEGS